MPWLERPAGVYTRHEVVLHRLDDPHPMTIQNRVTGQPTSYDVWELRVMFVFDATSGKWGVVSVKPFGYRRGSRDSVRVEIQGTTPELREFANRYAPDWIPDPSKAKTWLPAEAVYDEAADAIMKALSAIPSMTKSMYVRLDQAVRDAAANPYRGE